MENNSADTRNRAGCQIETVPQLSLGKAELDGLTIPGRVKQVLKRSFPAQTKRSMKRLAERFILSLMKLFPKKPEPKASSPATEKIEQGKKERPAGSHRYALGQKVRIRSKEEIESTLSLWGELKGCAFMKEMHPYCGTTHTIIRVVERFVDERDYQVKKGKGLYLLDGVMCEGTETYGRCDRACFFFWREEWLEAAAEKSMD